jgi:hypothetical protein
MIGSGHETQRRLNDYMDSIPREAAARRAECERAIDAQHMNDTLDQTNWALGRRR